MRSHSCATTTRRASCIRTGSPGRTPPSTTRRSSSSASVRRSTGSRSTASPYSTTRTSPGTSRGSRAGTSSGASRKVIHPRIGSTRCQTQSRSGARRTRRSSSSSEHAMNTTASRACRSIAAHCPARSYRSGGRGPRTNSRAICCDARRPCSSRMAASAIAPPRSARSPRMRRTVAACCSTRTAQARDCRRSGPSMERRTSRSRSGTSARAPRACDFRTSRHRSTTAGRGARRSRARRGRTRASCSIRIAALLWPSAPSARERSYGSAAICFITRGRTAMRWNPSSS